MKVTIIGGGVIGLCCAYYLDKDGYNVTVIDRNDITDGCSFGNMGFVTSFFQFTRSLLNNP